MRASLWLPLCLLLACSTSEDASSNPPSNLGGSGAGKGGSSGKSGSSGAAGQSGAGASAGGTGGTSPGQAGQGGGTSGQGGSSAGTSASGGASGQGAGGQGGSSQAGGQGGSDQGGNGGGTDPFEGYRQHCVDKINEYRATLGLAPYERWKEAEACADQMADHDADVQSPHDGFNKGICSPKGNGQNECPGYGSPDALDGCLAQMWAEGPSPNGEWDIPHGHYLNMVGEYTYQGFQVKFTRVACGFSSKGWFLQNFQ